MIATQTFGLYDLGLLVRVTDFILNPFDSSNECIGQLEHYTAGTLWGRGALIYGERCYLKFEGILISYPL